MGVRGWWVGDRVWEVKGWSEGCKVRGEKWRVRYEGGVDAARTGPVKGGQQCVPYSALLSPDLRLRGSGQRSSSNRSKKG